MKAAALALACLAFVVVAPVATAHPLAPSLLEIRENVPGTIRVRWKTPLAKVPGAEPRPVLPPDCTRPGELVRSRTDDAMVETWLARCEHGLVGAEISVSALAATRAPALLRVELADGRRYQSMLRADTPAFLVPDRESRGRVVRDYLSLGVEHIAGGFDHLLFLLALVLLVPRGRLLATVTAFTVGHSLTLSAAALGFVQFPTRPLEAMIAASILVLAVELASNRATFTRKRPWLVASGFGLLHGLGFAGALAEAGLPAGEIPLALFSFNVGIELGQVAFVLAIVVIRRALQSAMRAPIALRLASAYAVGCTSAFWLFERIFGVN